LRWDGVPESSAPCAGSQRLRPDAESAPTSETAPPPCCWQVQVTAFDTTICPLSGGGAGSRDLEPTSGVEPAQAAASPPDRMSAVEMATCEDLEACAAGAPALLGDLQVHAAEGDGVVASDRACLLDA